LCKQGAMSVLHVIWDYHTVTKLKNTLVTMVNQWQAAPDTVDGLM
jgi:hypothetical protein